MVLKAGLAEDFIRLNIFLYEIVNSKGQASDAGRNEGCHFQAKRTQISRDRLSPLLYLSHVGPITVFAHFTGTEECMLGTEHMFAGSVDQGLPGKYASQ